MVAASWLRSARAAVDPDARPPVPLAGEHLNAYRRAHPLVAVMPLLRELVGRVAGHSEHLMAVADADGRLLWVEGDARARRRAERIQFVEGAWWDEAHAGTNAPGTALVIGRPVNIHATEHFRCDVQNWTCAAAPIHDPVTGQLLGVVDITGGDDLAHPHSLALVTAAARAAMGELAHRPTTMAATEPPAGAVADRLQVLGRTEAVLTRHGGQIRLSRRHSEILFLLATHPDGRTGEQLADALYDEAADPGAVRVELTRLRRATGDLVQSRPYRLSRRLDLDFDHVVAELRSGQAAAAAAAYPGPLLPASEAPGVVAQRRWLDVRLRSSLLAQGSPDVLLRWAERFGLDDLEVWERLRSTAAPGSSLRSIAAVRVRQLHAEYGLR
jgi:hypothetical protein